MALGFGIRPGRFGGCGPGQNNNSGPTTLPGVGPFSGTGDLLFTLTRGNKRNLLQLCV